ncbi:RNA polymerase sigma factor [Umezawaea sp. Da 62-37]|uniref:RNA polymerase sigma factor n=1 Tax=Umezawaea sp. Da 62-37 TaxID=3075927 RepID=UPI0028F72FC0|nr:RNA polymerase sigma factor [Umezawaea sp. Da 62-37]WNV84210.1 RNA polymerase sigma factor [Umezawaea sp. Da 62-37]
MRSDRRGADTLAASPATDAELWSRGDDAAFGELYDRHAEAVWNHAYRLTGSWSTAEDLTSGAFLTAWRRRRAVALVRDSALPWLYAVTGYLAASEFRRTTRFGRLLRRVPLDDTVRDHADHVATSVDNDRELRSVMAAVSRLPKGEREAVELVLIGDVPIAEAAVVLGLAEASVRSRISRARARLRTTSEETR